MVSLPVADQANSARFWGRLPDLFAKLPQLVVLDLGGHSLGGAFPASLWQHPSLGHVLLPRNKLAGVLPTNISSSLVALDIRYNALQGRLPDSFCSIASLFLDGVSSLCGPVATCFVQKRILASALYTGLTFYNADSRTCEAPTAKCGSPWPADLPAVSTPDPAAEGGACTLVGPSTLLTFKNVELKWGAMRDVDVLSFRVMERNVLTSLTVVWVSPRVQQSILAFDADQKVS